MMQYLAPRTVPQCCVLNCCAQCARVGCTWQGLGGTPVVLGSCVCHLRIKNIAVHADDIEGPAGVTCSAQYIACPDDLFSDLIHGS